MVLHLGRINDVDETWVNGREVGATGSFPQDYKTAWTQDRRYTVPAESLRWGLGEENVLVIRVYDGGGDGGLTDLGAAEPPAIWRLPSSVSPAQVTVAGFFNWGEGRRSVSVTPSDLGATRRGQRAHLWDVWDARYLGTTTGSAPLDIAPTSCRLLSIVPDVGHPQLLGTDAHVTSGAQSVVGVKWDARHRALKGRSRVRPGVPFHLALTVPRGLGLFRLDVTGARAERLPSADGSALFRITPDRDEVVWVARYTRG
jgi:hypothetical protein